MTSEIQPASNLEQTCPHIAHFALAIVVVAIPALLVCRDRKSIRIRYVIQLLAYRSTAGLLFPAFGEVWACKGFAALFVNCSGLQDKGLISYSAAWAAKARSSFLKVLARSSSFRR